MLTSRVQKKAYPNTLVFQFCLRFVYEQFNGIYKDLHPLPAPPPPNKNQPNQTKKTQQHPKQNKKTPTNKNLYPY